MASEQGKHFGRYELQARIGRGGMAETWRARLMGAAGVTKSVLIKKVLPEFAGDEAFISMFISEARISATLSHGNVAQVFDFGQVDGNYFLAMEYVDGQPLHRILKRALRSGFSCLPAPVATFIALEMCRGLHYAHTRADEKGVPLGIVHRDISPDNVLVSYEGQVKIVDFGIAKARSLRSFDTAPGVVKGKYLFFSPEQARGEQVDARTDVWATGVVLFLLACGRLPLEGPEYEVMRKLVGRQALPRPRDVRPDLPPALDAIIQKALARRKEDRFESAHALGDALAGFLYRSAPRFSSMSVAYLLRELFREELSAEGRDTQVPPSFLEELSVWRASPLPRPTDPAAPGFFTESPPQQLTTEPQTLERVAKEPKALAPPRAKDAPTRPDRAALRPDGSGLSVVVGGVALLALAGLLWLVFPWLQADWAAQEQPQPPTPRPAPSPTRTATGAVPPKPQVVEAPGAPASVSWPVDAFQLEARQHVFRVSRALAALGMLDPRADWRLVETTLLTDADRGRSLPPLFFLLTGQGVDADAAVGTVSRKPEVLRGASGLMLFTVGAPTTRDDLPERTVTATHVRTGEVRRFTLHPEWMTAAMDRALVLTGLLPEETYGLAVEPVGEGAFTRGREQGPTLTVACVQQVRPEETPPDRALRFLLTAGEEARVTGVRGLHCGFVDDDASDNEGAVRVLVQKARPLPERGSPAFRVQGLPRGPGTARQDKKAPPPPATTRAEPPERSAPEATPAEARPQAVLDGALALFKAGKYEAARARARQCVAHAPHNAECHLLLGSVEARLGHREEGAKHYRRFLELAPGDHPQASQVLRVLQEYEAE